MGVKRLARKVRGPRPLWLSFFVALLALLLAARCVESQPDPLTLCVQHTEVAMHIHATLVPILDRQPQSLPGNIGITPQCMRPLHTHEADFVVHIESPKQANWSVGDFFRVWGPGNPYQGLNAVNVSVNGERHTGDYRKIVFQDGMRLVIEFASQ